MTEYEFQLPSATVNVLDLERLKDVLVIGEAEGYYRQNCVVRLNDRGHARGVQLEVELESETKVFEVHWQTTVTEQILRNYRDTEECTDKAACAIALLMLPCLTEYEAYERSAKGSTIDYYLKHKGEETDDLLIFNDAKARLEVSGIRQETSTNTIDGRVKDKYTRLKPDPNGIPDLIIIVEFGKPQSKMVRYDYS